MLYAEAVSKKNAHLCCRCTLKHVQVSMSAESSSWTLDKSVLLASGWERLLVDCKQVVFHVKLSDTHASGLNGVSLHWMIPAG